VAWSVQSEPTGTFGRRVGVEAAAEHLYDPKYLRVRDVTDSA
jgi:hypothetical protein